MWKKFLFFIIASLLMCPFVASETIFLKDGRVIKGEIIKRASYYVTIMEGNSLTDYYDDEIDRIEEDVENEDSGIVDVDASNTEVTSGKEELVVTLLRVNGTMDDMRQRIAKIIDEAPQNEKAKLNKLFNVDEIVNTVIPIYLKYYTKKDLEELIRFHQSPTGQKVSQVAPLIIKETVDSILDYFQKKIEVQNFND